jgi:hypothetical protein
VSHNTLQKTTSWKFEIVYIYTPEEMKYAHRLIDRNKETGECAIICVNRF